MGTGIAFVDPKMRIGCDISRKVAAQIRPLSRWACRMKLSWKVDLY